MRVLGGGSSATLKPMGFRRVQGCDTNILLMAAVRGYKKHWQAGDSWQQCVDTRSIDRHWQRR